MSKKVKAYSAGEKRVFHKLALAMVAAEIENKVIKPQTEKETGKPYKAKGGYLDIYLNSDLTVKRVWKTFQKEVQKVRSDYLKYAEAEKDDESRT
ncbi:hypothetical protein [Colwellia psychrerythraea]|uniref:Uncharacterized protein n=1 Tax=Colwellia psychrerythraea TaxID=28229 RepID=A0A099K9Y2_COLPS|nr:hypothetical protein [Colwellia psychrerythraea]KGJ86433.1 hypothetical protein ND2E_0999 [Colwellia psychrerythraea]